MAVLHQSAHLVVKKTESGLTEPVAVIVRINGNPRPIIYSCEPMSCEEIASLIETGDPEILNVQGV